MTTPTRQPLVSVGMPVYNGQEFVAEAMRSILSQDDVELELVVSDNGSTDDTEKICRAIADGDSRVRYLRSAENRGAAWNFNRVVHEARGHYFQWAAHDDLHVARTISMCVDVLEQNKGVVLCYGRTVDIDASGQVLHTYPPLIYANGDSPARRGRDVLATPSPCFEVFGLMRREQLLATEMIGAYTSSDRALLYELALAGRFHEVPDVLFLHRQHEARSVFQHRDPRAREAWFDPDRATKSTLPRWRLVGEHVQATRRAQSMSAWERTRAFAYLAAWAAGKAGPLARDLSSWGRHLLRAS